MIDELRSNFESLEIDGRKAVDRIYRKEEIYNGPYLDQAPDLVLLPSKGFNFKGSLKATKLSGRGAFTGKHTQQHAFLVINDPSPGIIPNKPCVSDVVGIMGRLKEKRG